MIFPRWAPHFLLKQEKKYIQKKETAQNLKKETEFKYKYQKDFNPLNKIKVFIYQEGYEYQFTRFYQSTIKKEFNFYLVDEPHKADVIVFMNTIEPKVIKAHQRVIFFYHEPAAYKHLYQTSLPNTFLIEGELIVVSHLKQLNQIITQESNPNHLKAIRHEYGIPYIHFHHMATAKDLDHISPHREKKICSVISGFEGIPGYDDRRKFLNDFSKKVSDFDLFGRYGKTIRKMKNYRGYSPIKFETISQYRYNLVIENSKEDWYISEKIFDSLICGCMPIYYGSDKIFEILPREWFIYLPDLTNHSLSLALEFIQTDQYKIVSENRDAIANFINREFNFFEKLNSLLIS